MAKIVQFKSRVKEEDKPASPTKVNMIIQAMPETWSEKAMLDLIDLMLGLKDPIERGTDL